METLDNLLLYLSSHSYWGVFLLILTFSTIVPISKTMVIVGAGVLAAQGYGNVWLYLLDCVAGLVVADSLYYGVGRISGRQVLQWRWFASPVRQQRLQVARERFRRHDSMAVFTARFLPYVRSFIFIIAGLNRMSAFRFFFADLLSACLYAPPMLFAGYLLAENRQQMLEYVQQGEYLAALLVLSVIVVLIVVRRRGRR